MTCVVCNDPTVAARKIVENDLTWAFTDNMPITPGHSLIVPKRHVASIGSLTREERVAILELAEVVKNALKKAFSATGFNVAYNENKVAGQTVEHFHMHIVPRTAGDTGTYEYEPRKFLYRTGSRLESPQAELLDVARLIRKAL